MALETVTMAHIEQALIRCNEAQPTVDCVLSPDMSALCEVLSAMIYGHVVEVSAADFDENTREVLVRWVVA